jgi:GTPase
MLYDKARIFVQGGAGGNGVASFRREAHVPRGGPDGGDGGRGGAVVLLCDDSLRDLQSFKRRAHYKAARGRHGEGALRHGADGGDLIVRVPPGTYVCDWTGTAYDLVVPGTRVVLAAGGPGGRGNKRFASATRQAPHFAERGLPGEEGWAELRLKLLADVGLVGLPNAGKSSLLARLTRAAPKVAGYPFTTLEPVLGTLESEDRQIVIADIPGLIEGANEGAGLGTRFLGHIERCRVLLHLVDATGEDMAGAYRTVRAELKAYGAGLEKKKEILALSKCDALDEATLSAKAAELKAAARKKPLLLSAASGRGVGEALAALSREIERAESQERKAAGASSEPRPWQP